MLSKDQHGNLYFVDRTKDASENISSMEVENEINAHSEVVECAVVPVATDTEQEVLAVIVVQREYL